MINGESALDRTMEEHSMSKPWIIIEEGAVQ
jgi:hypothetical protein